MPLFRPTDMRLVAVAYALSWNPIARLAAKQLEAEAKEAALGGDDATLLKSIVALEMAQPASDVLLDDAKEASRLAGRWTLLATLAAKAGETVEASGQRGVVNASGLVLAADQSRTPVQEIDVDGRRIANELLVSTPFGPCVFRVSGLFQRGSNARRADVDFDEIEVFDQQGVKVWGNTWLFSVARFFNPSLFTGGNESTAWLETTYLSDTLRVGRGNKGSCFLLEKGPSPLPRLGS